MERQAEIADNLKKVHENIIKACERAGRSPEDVKLICVSKTKPFSDIVCAYENGEREFGENKPQEIRDKYKLASETEGIEPVFHMIGSLQSNKIKYVVGTTKLIHSVDSIMLADAISQYALAHGQNADILLEVNVAREESKHGFEVSELDNAVMKISSMKGVTLKGLMTVAPFVDDAEQNRTIFSELRHILVDINKKNYDNVIMTELSMGMTNDYEIAIEEGATYVRVGSGIFGERYYKV